MTPFISLSSTFKYRYIPLFMIMLCSGCDDKGNTETIARLDRIARQQTTIQHSIANIKLDRLPLDCTSRCALMFGGLNQKQEYDNCIESCLPRLGLCVGLDIVLGSQLEVDEFGRNYPNCTNWNGSITIQTPFNAHNDIMNLDGLSHLRSIQGLTINSQPELRNISGLSNLRSTSYLRIISCRYISNLSSLVNLQICDELDIHNCPKVADLSPLNNLIICSQIILSRNEALTDINGFNGIRELDYLRLSADPVLTGMSGLSNLEHVGVLEVVDNDVLASFDDLEGLVAVGRVNAQDNPDLTDCAITAVCQLIEIGGIAAFHNNGDRCNSTEIVFDDCRGLLSPVIGPVAP